MTTDQKQSLIAVVVVLLLFGAASVFLRLTKDVDLPGWLPMAGLVVVVVVLFGPVRRSWRRAQRQRERDS